MGQSAVRQKETSQHTDIVSPSGIQSYRRLQIAMRPGTFRTLPVVEAFLVASPSHTLLSGSRKFITFHNSKALNEFEAYNGTPLFFPPAYASWPNTVEDVFPFVKKFRFTMIDQQMSCSYLWRRPSTSCSLLPSTAPLC